MKNMNFVFDLDGTICFQGNPISSNIFNCLHALEQDVIFASARPIRDMLPVLHKRFHTYTLIGGNGSLIYKNRKLVHAHTFTNEQLGIILKLVHKHQATFLIDSDWDYAYTGPDDHPIVKNIDRGNLAQNLAVNQLTQVVKILIVTMNDYTALFKELEVLDVTIHKHHNEQTIDISPRGIDKWSALKKLGIAENNYIAFGNDANDISMFKHAAHSVMIGNHKELAYYADEKIDCEEQVIINKIRTLAKGDSIF